MEINLRKYDDKVSKSKVSSFTFNNNDPIELFVKRDDLIHHEVSGNKWRKLKWNLLAALQNNCNVISTYGGAYSNHLLATASLGHDFGIPTRAYVRGDELNQSSNSLLKRCYDLNMDLRFIDRKRYFLDKRTNGISVDSKDRIWNIPEGGANKEGVEGCKEIIQETNNDFDFIFIAQGTSTTSMGILSAMNPNSTLVVVPVLKGYESIKEMKWLHEEYSLGFDQSKIIVLDQFHFGGYAKYNDILIDFVEEFNQSHTCPTGPETFRSPASCPGSPPSDRKRRI
jgi:1-aminocyclopropane-1-carboxylate deaminase